jgi:hypothetical protein
MKPYVPEQETEQTQSRSVPSPCFALSEASAKYASSYISLGRKSEREAIRRRWKSPAARRCRCPPCSWRCWPAPLPSSSQVSSSSLAAARDGYGPLCVCLNFDAAPRYCRRHGGVSVRRCKLWNGHLQRAAAAAPRGVEREHLRVWLLPWVESARPHPHILSLLHPHL